MRGKELLTPVQREELLYISVEAEHELALHYTFSAEDLEIINQHRRDHNRLGFAVQLSRPIEHGFLGSYDKFRAN
ncbi:protein of unknown function [Bacillus sp. ok061]|nr:protein of unknown function [Bacillus sp. ok061]